MHKLKNLIRYWLSQKKEAALSLFLALIVPLIALFFLVNLAYTERCIREYDASRFLKSAGNLGLASYERKLWRDFGLWGVSPEKCQLKAAEVLLEDLGKIYQGPLKSDFTQALFCPEEIKAQILRYMELRATVVLADDSLARLRSAASWRQGLSGGTALATVRAKHQEQGLAKEYQKSRAELELAKKLLVAGDNWEIANEVAEQIDKQSLNGADTSPKEVRTDPERVSEEAECTPADSQFLRSLFAGLERKLLPIHEAMGTSKAEARDKLSPNLIEQLAAKLDMILDEGLGLSFEQMQLAEYAILQFPAWVNIERGRGYTTEIYTPNGQSLVELARNRPQELEQISSGISNKWLAQKYCDAMLCGLRFIPQYIAGGKIPARQATYERWSKVLDFLISTLSMGKIKLPHELLKYLLQAADSLRHAEKDLKILKNGEALSFWPRESISYFKPHSQFYEFYYRDYLRILLYLQTPEILVEQMQKLIHKQYPGDYYSSFTLQVKINQRSLTYDFCYLDDDNQELQDLLPEVN